MIELPSAPPLYDLLRSAGDGGIATPLATGWPQPGERSYQCPRCGGVEHTDSTIPGACPLCAGLVLLEDL